MEPSVHLVIVLVTLAFSATSATWTTGCTFPVEWDGLWDKSQNNAYGSSSMRFDWNSSSITSGLYIFGEINAYGPWSCVAENNDSNRMLFKSPAYHYSYSYMSSTQKDAYICIEWSKEEAFMYKYSYQTDETADTIGTNVYTVPVNTSMSLDDMERICTHYYKPTPKDHEFYLLFKRDEIFEAHLCPNPMRGVFRSQAPLTSSGYSYHADLCSSRTEVRIERFYHSYYSGSNTSYGSTEWQCMYSHYSGDSVYVIARMNTSNSYWYYGSSTMCMEYTTAGHLRICDHTPYSYYSLNLTIRDRQCQCAQGTWGEDCAQSSNCDSVGTYSTDVNDGTCHCKAGWSGNDCSVDIDECTDTPHLCDVHADCVNTIGSYQCSCHSGFVPTLSGECGGVCTFPSDFSGEWTDTLSLNEMEFDLASASISSGWNITAYAANLTSWTCEGQNDQSGLLLFRADQTVNFLGNRYHVLRCMKLTKINENYYHYQEYTRKNDWGDRLHIQDFSASAAFDVDVICDGQGVEDNNDVHFLFRKGHLDSVNIVCPDILLSSMSGMTEQCSDYISKYGSYYSYYTNLNGTVFDTCSDVDTINISNSVCTLDGFPNYYYIWGFYYYHSDMQYRCMHYFQDDDVVYTTAMKNTSDFIEPYCIVSKFNEGNESNVLLLAYSGSCNTASFVNWTNAFTLQVNHSCLCPPGTWGRDCNQMCACVTNNTKSCSRSDGTCVCAPGWQGSDCSQDVDECADATLCTSGTCVNTVGSFDCSCPQFFVYASDGGCECDTNRYGSDCSSVCTCVDANTKSCRKSDGTCECQSGWTGTNCQTDIDECQQSNICGGFAQCVNYAGYYDCECANGFFKNADDVCFDGFSFGTETGDSILRGDDVVTEISIPPTIKFGALNLKVEKLYLSTNGHIGLDKKFGNWPWIRWIDDLDKLIAPFWTDLDTGNNGNVFYRAVELKGSKTPADDRKILNSATSIIRKEMNKKHFTAKWMFIATWSKVTLYGRSEPMTFQATIISNRAKQTYLIFNFVDLDLPTYWGYRYWWYYWRYVDVGYRIGPFNQDYFRNDYSGWRDTAFQLSTLIGNLDNKTGQWLHRLAWQQNKVPSDEEACYEWYMEKKYENDEHFALVRDPELVCPCREDNIKNDAQRYDFRWEYIRSVSTWWGYNMTCYAARTFSMNHSMECCYWYSRWVRWWWWDGVGRFLEYNPFTQPKLYRQNDELPRQQCCSTNHCDWYREVRPRGFCYRETPFRISWTFGDPHIKTLDGRQYTFNGRGEYTMMNVETGSKTFTLQARTNLAVTEDGQETNATVFTAFAAKDQSGATVQVELSNDTNSLVVFANGDDITMHFTTNMTYSKSETNLVISRANDTCQSFFPASGVTLKITRGIRLLTVVVVGPADIKGNSTGLLGNYDDDDTNDFIMKNGTVLSVNSTHRQIYEFGQSWMINPSESIFNYTSGSSANDYSFPHFEPLFVDEVDPQKLANATTECGGSSASQACIFDYLATGDKNLAQQSGQTDNQGNADSAALSNISPDITGDEIVYANINEPVQLVYNASDDGTFSYVYLNTPTSNFVVNESSGQAIVTWTPTSTHGVNISVTALDDHNVYAPTIDTVIVLCSGCSNRGTCNNNVTRETDTPNFYLASCECDDGYDGNDCESDFDGCVDTPCSQGRTCIDLDPIEHALLDRAYNCSDCPIGYLENNTKCVDVDECLTPSSCPQKCVNTEGSFICECFTGYRMFDSTCVDVDECADQTHECEQNCVNEDGTYRCTCAFGYELNSGGKTCTQVMDVCAISGLSCSYACDNSTTGSFECICPKGFQLGNDGTSCIDVDECQMGICTQECHNTNGSYSCSCFNGYGLGDDHVSCIACLPPKYGKNCSSTCTCGLGMDYCDPVKGCVCMEGYEGVDCTVDVDECAENPGICQSSVKYCENDVGTYSCLCYEGYLEVNNSCVDIDECADVVTNDCPIGTSVCENNAGSYTCICNAGYIQNGPYACTDIDECTQNSHGCEQGCQNVPGSYNCRCEAGFQLQNDRTTCTKVSDPCPAYTGLTCTYGCRLNGNTPECFCQSGYTLGTDQQTCIDIDECSDTSLNKCNVQNNCVNTAGGHNCSCDVGYKLENDGRTCSACDQYHYGQECVNKCECGPGAIRCDSVSGCVCGSGWLGDKCDTDIDECQYSTPVCTASHTKCVNSPGTYHCMCDTGYEMNNATNQCEDIDECATGKVCALICVNTPGSYHCACETGFQLVNGSTCVDLDECAAIPSQCDHLCINSQGGYTCSCHDGYNLNVTNRRSCHAKTECTVKTCEHSCAVNSTAHENCICNNGYKLNADGITCNNIDECSLDNPCSSGLCTDLTPGFSCSCPDGQQLSDDKVSCFDCSDGTYGTGCSSNCTCASATTVSCDKVTGACTCETGYTGSNCDTDIDECVTGVVSCPANSDCVNIPGSYKCTCYDGYAQSNSVCVECSSTRWGTNCLNNCSCNIQNTMDCNNKNGTCHCSSGWQDSTCSTDVNECQTSGICGAHAQCTNTAGSYTCTCDPGYEGADCNTDINECSVTPWICGSHGTCVNNIGSYTCTCDSGWSGAHCSDGDCTIDRTICGQNMDCDSSGSTNECVCQAGYTKSSSGECTVLDTTRTIATVILRLDIDINAVDISDTTSAVYYSIFDLIKLALQDLYASLLPSASINLISISKGSVIANHQVVVNSGSASSVSSAVLTLNSGTQNVTYNGSQVAVQSVSVGNTALSSSSSLCDVYTTITPCSSGTTCQVQDGVASCSVDSTSSSSSNVGLIAGIAVGAIVIVGVAVAVIIFCIVKKSKLSKRPASATKRVGLIPNREYGSSLFQKSKTSLPDLFAKSDTFVSDSGSDVSWAITSSTKHGQDNRSFISGGDIDIQASSRPSSKLSEKSLTQPPAITKPNPWKVVVESKVVNSAPQKKRIDFLTIEDC